jgi:hypothetical protein
MPNVLYWDTTTTSHADEEIQSTGTVPYSMDTDTVRYGWDAIIADDVETCGKHLACRDGIQRNDDEWQRCIFARNTTRARPGTSSAIASQILSPCVCKASFGVSSSSTVQLPLRPVAGLMLAS